MKNAQGILLLAMLGALAVPEQCLAQRDAARDSTIIERAARSLQVFGQANQEYVSGQYTSAARDFDAVVHSDSNNLPALSYLGHSYFHLGRYQDAIVPYQRALALEQHGSPLSRDDHRLLIDQLTMSYGMSGQLANVYATLDTAIRTDPEYALNYYNLACAYAEEGKKENMLASLKLAYQHKEHMLNGEHIPDPRIDSSFEKYLTDQDFQQLLKSLGWD